MQSEFDFVKSPSSFQDDAFEQWQSACMSSDSIISTSVAARVLGLHPFHFSRVIREGKGPKATMPFGGGSYIMLWSDFLAWVNATGRRNSLKSPVESSIKSDQEALRIVPAVYFVSDCSGCVKIGMTRGSVLVRVNQLQTGSSTGLRLIATIPCQEKPFLVERQAHLHFAAYRASGEWFQISEEEAIGYAVRAGGMPA